MNVRIKKNCSKPFTAPPKRKQERGEKYKAGTRLYSVFVYWFLPNSYKSLNFSGFESLTPVDQPFVRSKFSSVLVTNGSKAFAHWS